MAQSDIFYRWKLAVELERCAQGDVDQAVAKAGKVEEDVKDTFR